MRGSSHSNDPFARMIQNLPLDKNALHDIRLRFEVKDIWKYLSICHPELFIRQNSGDILIPTWDLDRLAVRVTIHRTDTVSISVGCALEPVAADINGVIRLSNALTRVEERLNVLLRSAHAGVGRPSNDRYSGSDVANTVNSIKAQQPDSLVPNHNLWTATMWHFGADSLTEYSAPKFHVAWEVGKYGLVRAYTKTLKDKKTRIRLERQEYPNSTLAEAIEDKLNSGVGRL